MDIKVTPSVLSGSVKAIGSKSDIHRLLICAALADGMTEIDGFFCSEDVYATLNCIRALGADADITDDICTVYPAAARNEHPHFDCGESGSTLRFMLPVSCAVCRGADFTGKGRLPDRPLKDLINALRSGGISFSGDRLPFSTRGTLASGRYLLPGNISSQYISGLLMALSVADGDSVIGLTAPPESEGYIDMTISTLSLFGNRPGKSGSGYIIHGCGLKSPGRVCADGDWSNAAFFLVAGAIGGDIELKGLNSGSLQRDKRILDILKRFGADIAETGGSVRVSGNRLAGCDIDLAQIPDLLPALAVAAAFAYGDTHFTGGARLRMKESDRISSVCAMIRSLGGDAEELEDGLTVHGRPDGLDGGIVDSANDHRIVMAAAVASSFCKNSVTIKNADAVGKSYPTFFDDFRKAGGRTDAV